ncbi:GL18882 [Drosophila persimilis]|uniref:GL18882 n=1 Tax=Drosophila persimilis TaxID=7234 RepID=B4G890_DROPE|nr:GL18882 [Drosophila persimilis]
MYRLSIPFNQRRRYLLHGRLCRSSSSFREVQEMTLDCDRHDAAAVSLSRQCGVRPLQQGPRPRDIAVGFSFQKSITEAFSRQKESYPSQTESYPSSAPIARSEYKKQSSSHDPAIANKDFDYDSQGKSYTL